MNTVPQFVLCRFGRLHFNSIGLCPMVLSGLIKYWQIDELLLGNRMIKLSILNSFIKSKTHAVP